MAFFQKELKQIFEFLLIFCLNQAFNVNTFRSVKKRAQNGQMANPFHFKH